MPFYDIRCKQYHVRMFNTGHAVSACGIVPSALLYWVEFGYIMPGFVEILHGQTQSTCPVRVQGYILQGAQEVVKGVFMGGFEEARHGIRIGSKQAEQFR